MKHWSRRQFLERAAVLGSCGSLSSRLAAAAAGQPLPAGIAAPSQPGSRPHATAPATLFVGTQTGAGSKGIYAYSWDSKLGWLTSIGLAAEVPMPTYLSLSPNRQYLFAANETDSFAAAPDIPSAKATHHASAAPAVPVAPVEHSGGVTSFRIGPRPGRLTPINSQLSGGAGSCYVGVDPTGQTLLAANYSGGSAASFHIGPDGALSTAVSEFHYAGHGPDPARQEASHVHRGITSPSGRYAFFDDLGLDLIHIYRLDSSTARLTPHEPAAWQAPAGSGPRTLRFHPNGRWAYCALEMAAGVAVLEWNEADGAFSTLQVIALTPADYSGPKAASECIIDPTGRFAYASCRFYDTLVTFAVDPKTGRLTMLDRTTCGGQVPRDITLDPSGRWMLVANQATDSIAIIERDLASGRLSDKATTVALVRPQCLVFV